MPTIKLGHKDKMMGVLASPDGKKGKAKTVYPSLSIPGADCEDCPKTGTATIEYQLVGLKTGKGTGYGNNEKSVEIEIKSITFPEGGGEEDDKTPDTTAGDLEGMLKGAAGGGEPGGDEDEGSQPAGDEDEGDGEQAGEGDEEE